MGKQIDQIKKNSGVFTRLTTWSFWRNQMIAFCVFSLLGHWVEIPYCMFNDAMFGIVDPDTGVFADFMEPYLIYGFSIVICNIVLVPIRNSLTYFFKPRVWIAVVLFFVTATVLAMDLELIQGFLQNQPDANGVYPLWDNSKLPLNVAGQAWLVNDMLLGLILTVYIWVLEPGLARILNRTQPQRAVDIAAFVIVIAFIILCLIKFVFFPVH